MHRKSRLEENSFAFNDEIFLAPDIDKELKKLEKAGQLSALSRLPQPTAKTFSAPEKEVMRKIRETATQTVQSARKHLGGFKKRLEELIYAPSDAVRVLAEEERTNMKNNIETILGTRLSKQKITLLNRTKDEAEERYARYCKENKIEILPDSKVFWSVVLIILVAIGEVVLNTAFLSDLTGILAALAQMLLITAVNVFLLAAPTGLMYRYKNLQKGKWLILICLPLLLSALVFNLGVGHYRDAIVESNAQQTRVLQSDIWNTTPGASEEVDYLDYSQTAMRSVVDSPLGIKSILSFFWILIGFGFFIVASREWYVIFTPYPGLMPRYKALKKVRAECDNLVRNTRQDIKQERDFAIKKIKDKRYEAENLLPRYEDMLHRIGNLQKDYKAWLASLQKTQDSLLARYRDSNRAVRQQPPPEYFDDYPVLAFEDLDFKLPHSHEEIQQKVNEIVAIVERGNAEIEKEYVALKERFDAAEIEIAGISKEIEQSLTPGSA